MPTFVERAQQLVDELTALNAELDVNALDPVSLLQAGAAYAEVTLLAQGGVTLLAAAIDERGAYKRTGDRNAADWVARKTGTSMGAAHKTVNTGRKLKRRPKTADALRKGKVSAEQAGVIGEADPEDEDTLLGAAGRRGMKGLKEEAARCRQARESEADAMERWRRAHQERGLRTWTEGARFCFAGSTTLDEGARLMAAISGERERLWKVAYKAGLRESNEAYAVDALINVVSGFSGAARPKAALTVRADAGALARGFLQDGERCEIEGFGPIPVRIAESLLVDADVYGLLFGENGDLYDVSSTKRTIPASLRRALEALYPCCPAENCDQTQGLEIDHIVPLSEGGKTELSNMWRPCRLHHRLKTLGLLVVVGEPGAWRLVPKEELARMPA